MKIESIWLRLRLPGAAWWLAGLAVVLAACDDVMGPGLEQERLLQTDAESYEWTVTADGAGATIPYSFENRTGGVVQLANCQGAFSLGLQRLVGGRWEAFWSPLLPLCLSEPLEIPPGASFADTLAVFGGHPGSSFYPRFDTDDLEGVYRIIWHTAYVQYDADHLPLSGGELPLDSRVSNRFEMVTR